MAAGWDDLDYLDFTDSDLQDAGIDVAAHRALVSASFVLFWLIELSKIGHSALT